MQAPSGGNGKAIAYGIGIATVVGIFLYIFYKLGEMSQRVERVENNQKPRPNRDNEAPIDVTPETVTESAVSKAIVTTEKPLVNADSNLNSVTKSDSRFESAQSDSKSVKTIEKRAFEIRSDSNLESDPHSDLKSDSSSDWHHSPDFRAITANGVTHTLTLYQSRALDKLWKARNNRIPEVHQAAILEGIDSCSKRLRDVFKSNMKAYRALIARGERKGHFRLNFS